MPYIVEKITPFYKNDFEVIVKFVPSNFWKFFGFKEKTYTYFGSCTVWHELRSDGSYTRCCQGEEMFLSDALTTYKIKQAYSKKT